MDQENDILGYSPKVSEAAIQVPALASLICNIKERDKLNRRRGSQEYEQFKALSAQLLLFLTLLFSLLTTLGTVWLILRLKLINEPNLIESGDGNELVINQDLITDTLLLKDELETEKIVASRQIMLSGSSKFLPREQQASIIMNRDSIEMQAKSFSSGSLDYEFKLPKRLTNLEVLSGMKDVKLIRAPSSIKSLSNLVGNRPRSSDLQIVSSDDLELSGNLGLKVHSEQINIKSPESIHIQSRGDSIRLISKKGLRLPFIPIALDAGEELSIERNIFKSSSSEEEEEVLSNHSSGISQRSANRYQLCIDRNDGAIFQAVKSCA